MNSMTGYGRGEATQNGISLVVELKSVNHRFLDLTIKLPRALAFAEDTIKKLISSRITRGHIDVFTTFDAPVSKSAFRLNADVAAKYIEMASTLEAQFGVKNDYTASSLLKVPGVVEDAMAEQDEDVLLEIVTEATNKALDGLTAMRATEGKAITQDLLGKLDNIEDYRQKIEALAPSVVEEYKDNLTRRVQEALAGVAPDEARLITEVALFADKCCIDEELARLKTHVVHYREILSSTDAAGRKLDFLTQELNREVNTIGSKASNVAIAECVVLLKCEIEKVREQIQNLE